MYPTQCKRSLNRPRFMHTAFNLETSHSARSSDVCVCGEGGINFV